MNVPEEEIQARIGDSDSSKNEQVEIWPENVAVFNVFIELQTQWRISQGAILGFDYTAVINYLNFKFIKSRKKAKQIFNDLQIMERTALPLINKKIEASQ